MYPLLVVIFGLLIFEGANALPTSKEYDPKTGNSKYVDGRRMRQYHGQEHNSQYKYEYDYTPMERTKDKSLEVVISAIDNGVKTFINSENKTEIIGKVANSLVDLVKDSGKQSVFRAKAEEFVKPGIVRLRSDPNGKPTVMLELNSDSIVNGLKDLLRSKLVRQLLDHYTKEAAVVYRSVKKEINKRADDRYD